MKREYQVFVRAEWLVLVDDADSLEEAKRIVEDIYVEDAWGEIGYDYHAEWEIVEDQTYATDGEEA